GLHGANAPDAQHDLLDDAVLLVAAVEAVGDLAGVLVVALDIGVQQQQRHTPDLDLPDRDGDLAVPGAGDRHGQLLAGPVEHGLDGQRCGIVVLVLLLRPALSVQGLRGVSPLVGTAYSLQRAAQVGGDLGVVSG